MKFWWVLSWDNYYPDIDNFRASFETKEEALEWIDKAKEDRYPTYENYKVINVEGRLHDVSDY